MVWKSKPLLSAVARQSSRSGQVMRCMEGLAAGTVAMARTVTMDALRGDAEPAVGRPAIGSAVRARHSGQAGAAIPPRREPHRHRADGGTSHQGEDNASRALHGAVRSWLAESAIL